MSFKIVVGVNGAEGGADALAHRLAPPPASIVAVVVAVLDGQASPAVTVDYGASGRRKALTTLAEVRAAELPDLDGEVYEAASVGDGLQRAAERLEGLSQ